MQQDDLKPRRPTFSRSVPGLPEVSIGIHMQIPLEMTDGDEAGREELLLTWQGPTYP